MKRYIMFNEELFYDLCRKYEVEIREGRGKPKIYEYGIARDLTSNDVYNIVKQLKSEKEEN
jgi:hypothetical protein